jgi:hypothetical protein
VQPPIRTQSLVYVTTCTNERRCCRSFRCPRRADVVVKYDAEATADPTCDWFWCLAHWPLLRDMHREHGREISYSPEALTLVGEDHAGSAPSHA